MKKDKSAIKMPEGTEPSYFRKFPIIGENTLLFFTHMPNAHAKLAGYGN